jgi:hypothetical protein
MIEIMEERLQRRKVHKNGNPWSRNDAHGLLEFCLGLPGARVDN